jgi:hypothetical protein
MKISIKFVLIIMLLNGTALHLQAQTVFPGKQTIDKTEYLGLILNQKIPEKFLADYWETYLGRFGKVKSKRSTYSIAKASLPAISASPVTITSEVSSKKDLSQVFIALNVGGQYIANQSDDTYKNAEAILKSFSDYADRQEESRVANEAFTSAEKGYQKLLKENENAVKEIEKAEKKLVELRLALEQKKLEAINSLIDLQNKQKALDLAKNKANSQN